MVGVIRVGLLRILGRSNGLLNSQNAIPLLSQKCNISGKTLRAGKRPPKPAPWPYEKKGYGVFQAMFDKTTKRMDENSKIIVVEGPLAVGKTKFAKELAEELEMRYMPQANMDGLYVNSYGFDLRQLDSHVPELTRSFDEKNFCRDPNHPLVARFQIQLYIERFFQYVNALEHLLSTGQGVVLERCPHSDLVFLEAMHRNGYISKGARSVYHEIRQLTLPELLKPHLVVYLDAPVNVVKENIKKRNLDYEVNSKALNNDKYLQDLESIYKQEYLKDISVHAELLVYDWSAGGDTEVVVEDIERIDFGQFEVDRHDKKMKDWKFGLEWDWCEARIKYCNEKGVMLKYFNIPRFDVPELLVNADDAKKWRDIWYSAPGMKYIKGYNEDMGDTGILTKLATPYRQIE